MSEVKSQAFFFFFYSWVVYFHLPMAQRHAGHTHVVAIATVDATENSGGTGLRLCMGKKWITVQIDRDYCTSKHSLNMARISELWYSGECLHSSNRSRNLSTAHAPP